MKKKFWKRVLVWLKGLNRILRALICSIATIFVLAVSILMIAIAHFLIEAWVYLVIGIVFFGALFFAWYFAWRDAEKEW